MWKTAVCLAVLAFVTAGVAGVASAEPDPNSGPQCIYEYEEIHYYDPVTGGGTIRILTGIHCQPSP